MKANGHALREGILAGLIAYVIWGLVPAFFKQLGGVPALEIIAHRVLWSLLLLALLLHFTSGYAQIAECIRSPRKLARVTLGAVLVMANWLIFVYAVNSGRIVATSLGYFMLPIFNIALGVALLGERLRPLQWVAVAAGAGGVLFEAWRIGGLPWISLALAGTFGVYGLLRKHLAMDAASGLFMETLSMTPLALGYVLWLEWSAQGHFLISATQSSLLIASGAVTATPLLFFALAARRLPLNTMGFLQYLAPSISLGVGVLVYAEPFAGARIAGFACIWAGIALYSFDLWRHSRRPTPSL